MNLIRILVPIHFHCSKSWYRFKGKPWKYMSHLYHLPAIEKWGGVGRNGGVEDLSKNEPVIWKRTMAREEREKPRRHSSEALSRNLCPKISPEILYNHSNGFCQALSWKCSHFYMQILFLSSIWKPHVIFKQPAQTDWQTTSLRKWLICHQVSTLRSSPLWSRPIILHLYKYICVAYLFTCCWGEQMTLHSFLGYTVKKRLHVHSMLLSPMMGSPQVLPK